MVQVDLVLNFVIIELQNKIDKYSAKSSKDITTPGKVKEIIEKLNQLHVSDSEDMNKTFSPPQMNRTISPPQAAKITNGQATASKQEGNI